VKPEVVQTEARPRGAPAWKTLQGLKELRARNSAGKNLAPEARSTHPGISSQGVLFCGGITERASL